MSDISDNLSGRSILLGVCGGIAAYKAIDLASKLVSNQASVTVVMTENASKLVAPKSFEAITRKPVLTSMWNAPEDFKISHIDITDDADAVVVAPATANIIAKTAQGLCDDLLSTTLCAAWQTKTLFAPAMNTRMWTNPVVQRNIKLIQEAGIELVGPEKGRLACGDAGIGRMSEPQAILEKLSDLLSQSTI